MEYVILFNGVIKMIFIKIKVKVNGWNIVFFFLMEGSCKEEVGVDCNIFSFGGKI